MSIEHNQLNQSPHFSDTCERYYQSPESRSFVKFFWYYYLL